MDSYHCIEVGEAFRSVRYNEELFKTALQRFALFELDNGFIEYAKQNLQVFKKAHIRLLHKNYLQSEEIKKHVWIVSEKMGRNMKDEATEDWIMNHHEAFNQFYYSNYYHKFIDADISDIVDID